MEGHVDHRVVLQKGLQAMSALTQQVLEVVVGVGEHSLALAGQRRRHLQVGFLVERHAQVRTVGQLGDGGVVLHQQGPEGHCR